MKRWLKFISSVVVFAFTVTSIIQHPSYAQDFKLAPESRFKSQITADELTAQVNAELKNHIAGKHLSTPEAEDRLLGIVRWVLSGMPSSVNLWRGNRTGIADLLLRQQKTG